MTTNEENEIRRLSLKITRAANIMGQPFSTRERWQAACELCSLSESARVILSMEHNACQNRMSKTNTP